MKGWEGVTPEQLASLAGRSLVLAPKTPQQKRPKIKRFDFADLLLEQIRLCKLQIPEREFRPWPDRRFKIDLTWHDRMLFAECDGGQWIHGQHGRGQGMADDCYKWNRLILEGWTGLRFAGSMVQDGSALATLETALKSI